MAFQRLFLRLRAFVVHTLIPLCRLPGELGRAGAMIIKEMTMNGNNNVDFARKIVGERIMLMHAIQCRPCGPGERKY